MGATDTELERWKDETAQDEEVQVQEVVQPYGCPQEGSRTAPDARWYPSLRAYALLPSDAGLAFGPGQ